jgi:hypothetical protein
MLTKNKAIKPLLAAAQELRPSRGAENARVLDTHYDTIRMASKACFRRWSSQREHQQLFCRASPFKRLIATTGSAGNQM